MEMESGSVRGMRCEVGAGLAVAGYGDGFAVGC